MKKLILTTLLILLLPCMAWAATYYVAQTAAGDGLGGSYVNRASVATHNAGGGNFAALDGDTVVLTGTITTPLVPPDSGSSGSVVTYDGDDGVNPACTFSGGSSQIYASQVDYIDVKDITFTGQTFAGVHIENCETWNITNCDFVNSVGGDGVRIETDIGDGNSGPILIQSCTFDHLDQGIYNTYNFGAGAGEHVVGLTIDQCVFSNLRTGYQDYHGTDIANFNACSAAGRMTHNLIITDNTVATTIGYAFNAACQGGTNRISGNRLTNIGDGSSKTNALQIGASWDLTIEGNVIIGPVDTISGDGHGIILDHQPRGNITQDCLRVHVRHNFISNCNDPDGTCSGIKIWDVRDSYIYNNVIVGCTMGFSISKTASTGNVYYGNTVYNPGSSCVDLWGESSPGYSVPATWWYNNIFYGGTYAFQVGSGAVIPTESNNLYYDNTFSSTGSLTPDGTDINADPKFTDVVNNLFSLLIASPAIDVGKTITTSPLVAYGLSATTDFTSTPPSVVTLVQSDHGTAWDIGAYIYEDPGAPANHAPNGIITLPASNPVIDETQTVTFAGSYYDADDDVCTYAWTFEASSLDIWNGTDTYPVGRLVIDVGAYYKCILESTNNDPPNATYWTPNAETLAAPGTAKYSTAGVYSVSLTVNDGTVGDPTPASRSITVQATGGTSPTTATWGRNTANDYATGDSTMVFGGATTTNYGTETDLYVKKGSSTAYDRHAYALFNLTAISGLTVNEAILYLKLQYPPNTTINIELWSITNAFTEAGATYATYDGSTAWSGTMGQATFLCELQFIATSTTGLYYAWASAALTTYINTVASTGAIAYLGLFSDALNTTAAEFYSDVDAVTTGNRPYLEITYGAAAPGSVPEVTNTTCNSTDGSYKVDDSIGGFPVTFSEPVNVTGTPKLRINTATAATLTYNAVGDGSASGGLYPDITFWWRCEGTTLDANLDYTAGDNTATLNSGALINADAMRYGTYGLDVPTAGDFAQFVVSGLDIVSDTEGRFGNWIRLIADIADNREFFRIKYDGDNLITLRMSGTDELDFYWQDNNVIRTALVTTTADMVVNTWYFVEIAWKTSTNYREIFVDGVSKGSSAEVINDLISDPIELYFGNPTAVLGDHHQDNVMISNDSTRDFNALKAETSYPRVSSLTYAVTVANELNRVLVVGVAYEEDNAATISSVTHNGDAMTLIGSALEYSDAAVDHWVALYYRLAPDVGAYNVVVTMSAGVNGLSSGAISLYNVAQAAPESYNSASGSSTTALVSLTTHVANSFVVDTVSVPGDAEDLTIVAGQTERYEESASLRHNGSTKPVASAGAASCSWTFTNSQAWGIFAASFQPYDPDTLVSYSSGSGSLTLTFAAFTVTAGMTEAEIDAVYIDLNGGSIAAADDATAISSTDEIVIIPTDTDAGSLKTAKDIVIKTSNPTVSGNIGCLVGGVYNADYSVTLSTIGNTLDILLPIDGQVAQVGNPYQAVLSLYVGPETTTVGYAYSLGVVEISGVWYLKLRLTLPAGMRTLDLQTIAVGSALDLNTCTIKDLAGNALTVTLPETDVGAIVIAVPYPSTSPKEFDATNTVAAYDTAGGYFIPLDFIKCTEANSIGTVDLSASDGTAGNVITIDGGGLAHPGNQTFGDYWDISRIIHGSTIVLGLGDTHKYSLIPEGDILQVPEGATGCDIHDDSIRGTLDLDETVTVKNTWVTTVDLAGIGAAETATFNNCAFLQSQATIEATLGVGGAVNFTDCLFGIATTNFRNYAGADFHLTGGSALKDVGYDTSPDIDIEGISTPQGANYDIGAYELRAGGSSMGMSMGLRGAFAPYRWED